MCNELQEYIVEKLRMMRDDFKLPRRCIEEANAKLAKCRTKIQVDNIVKTYLFKY